MDAVPWNLPRRPCYPCGPDDCTWGPASGNASPTLVVRACTGPRPGKPRDADRGTRATGLSGPYGTMPAGASRPSTGQREATRRASVTEIGTVLGGRYRLVELLGQGGMATIYRAHDNQLDRDVAVEAPAPGVRPRPGVRLALPPGGPERRVAEPPEHRLCLRLRPGRRAGRSSSWSWSRARTSPRSSAAPAPCRRARPPGSPPTRRAPSRRPTPGASSTATSSRATSSSAATAG